MKMNKKNIIRSIYFLIYIFLFHSYLAQIIIQPEPNKNLSFEQVVEQMTQVHKPKDHLHFRLQLDQFEIAIDTIKTKQTISDLALKHQITQAAIDSLMWVSRKIFNLNQIRAGKALWFLKNPRTSLVEYMIYELNELDYVVFILKDQRYSAIADRHLVVLEQDFFTAKIQKGSSISESIKSNFPSSSISKKLE